MKQINLIMYSLLIFAIFSQSNLINTGCMGSSTDLLALCKNLGSSCCVAGRFTTNGGQPIVSSSDPFCVQRISSGLYNVTLKKAFCCPISVIAIAEVGIPVGCTPLLSTDYTVSGPTGMVATPTGLAVSLDGKCLAVSNADLTTAFFGISFFPINSDCTLGTAMPNNIGFNIFPGMTFSSNNCFAITNPFLSSISLYKNTGCTISPVSLNQPSHGSGPFGLSISPDGTCLAVYNINTPNFSTFSITDCNPTFVTSVPTVSAGFGGAIQSIIFLSDKCLAVLTDVNKLSLYSISGCTPTLISTIDVGLAIIGMTFSQINGCLAVTNVTNTTVQVSVFQVVTDMSGNCSLNFVESKTTGAFALPISLDYSPDGNCLAVVNVLQNDQSSISIFSVNSDCTLTLINGGSPFPLPGTPGIASLKYLSPHCFATANIAANNISVFRTGSLVQTKVMLCEAITPGCFLIKLPDNDDSGAIVTFLATPCT